MKRPAILMALLAFVSMSFALSVLAQDASKDQKKDQKSDAQAATTPAPAPGKHRPEAKTQPEFDAYSAAIVSATPEAMEKAAEDFATKFPASEIKILLYKRAMQLYQLANNADKTIDLGRKCLTLDGDDPEALVDVAQSLAERTRDTDLDKEQKYAEAQKDAEKALQTVDTDLIVNAGTTQDKIDQYKSYLRSTAYGSLGIIYYSKDTKDDYGKAEDYLRKSIAALPSQPDLVTMLRLSIALDKQGKYTDALTEVNKLVEMTKKKKPQLQRQRQIKQMLEQK